jgi:hypothetical protein
MNNPIPDSFRIQRTYSNLGSKSYLADGSKRCPNNRKEHSRSHKMSRNTGYKHRVHDCTSRTSHKHPRLHSRLRNICERQRLRRLHTA